MVIKWFSLKRTNGCSIPAPFSKCPIFLDIYFVDKCKIMRNWLFAKMIHGFRFDIIPSEKNNRELFPPQKTPPPPPLPPTHTHTHTKFFFISLKCEQTGAPFYHNTGLCSLIGWELGIAINKGYYYGVIMSIVDVQNQRGGGGGTWSTISVFNKKSKVAFFKLKLMINTGVRF